MPEIPVSLASTSSSLCYFCTSYRTSTPVSTVPTWHLRPTILVVFALLPTKLPDFLQYAPDLIDNPVSSRHPDSSMTPRKASPMANGASTCNSTWLFDGPRLHCHSDVIVPHTLLAKQSLNGPHPLFTPNGSASSTYL